MGQPRNTPKYPKIPDIPGNTRNTQKYPKVKKIHGNTRSYFSTLVPDPNPTRYPVFCPIPDPTRPVTEKPYPLGTDQVSLANLWKVVYRIRIMMGKFGRAQIRTSFSSEKKKIFFLIFGGGVLNILPTGLISRMTKLSHNIFNPFLDSPGHFFAQMFP